MPQPKPRKGETEAEFISRCMGDKVMNDDFDDQDQRLAVCFDIWRKAKGEKKDMPKDTEYRSYPLTELRVATEDDHPKIYGHAAVFNRLSDNLGGFREKVAKGAFSDSIERDDIRALFNHHPNYVLGRTKSGTLALAEDDKGLAVEINPPEVQWATDLQESIRRKDIDQMSFGFETRKDSWEHPADGVKGDSIRTLLEVVLFDVSPVTFPAYPQTDVKVRAIFEQVGLDYDAISGVLFRSENGVALMHTDRTLIEESIAALQKLLTDAIPVLDGDGTVEQQGYHDRLIVLRRRLTVASL